MKRKDSNGGDGAKSFLVRRTFSLRTAACLLGSVLFVLFCLPTCSGFTTTSSRTRTMKIFRSKSTSTPGSALFALDSNDASDEDQTNPSLPAKNAPIDPQINGESAKSSKNSSTNNDGDLQPTSIRANLGPLLGLTRPKNFPGVVLFHLTGVYLAAAGATTGSPPSLKYYWLLVFTHPALWWILAALLLVDSTSMVVNDYFDAKLGRDQQDRILVDGRVSFATTKRFVSYLYAMCLVLTAFLPGIVARLSVVMGLILTYLYTQHLKPITWVKNIVCASLIALAPWTSGSAALFLLRGKQLAVVPSLFRLVGALFFGVLAREVLMDCNDVIGDEAAGVKTVPVVFGKQYASRVAFAGYSTMAALTCAGPVGQLWKGSLFPRGTAIRRLALACTASVWSLARGWKVMKAQASDSKMVQRTVDEGLLLVLLVLASFL